MNVEALPVPAPAAAPAVPDPKNSEANPRRRGRACSAYGPVVTRQAIFPNEPRMTRATNHRVGVVSCMKSIDVSVPPETTASLARSKVLSHLENEN